MSILISSALCTATSTSHNLKGELVLDAPFRPLQTGQLPTSYKTKLTQSKTLPLLHTVLLHAAAVSVLT